MKVLHKTYIVLLALMWIPFVTTQKYDAKHSGKDIDTKNSYGKLGTNQIPGCKGRQSESFSTKRLGCSTGIRGCVIEMVFSAPSLSCQSSSLQGKVQML